MLNPHCLPVTCRGCGSTPLTSPKPFSISDSRAVYEVVRHLRAGHPEAPLFMVGFSIGAYTLTKYVYEVDTGVFGSGES